jgi:DNA-binding NarL/FixJ family response regulator
MLEIIERAEIRYPCSNVILVSSCERTSDQLLDLISDRDLNVVGTSTRAATALALAAQVSADLAIVHHRLAGRRDSAELARRLEEIWGVPSLLIEKSEASEAA